jgi:hypothetical protein
MALSAIVSLTNMKLFYQTLSQLSRAKMANRQNSLKLNVSLRVSAYLVTVISAKKVNELRLSIPGVFLAPNHDSFPHYCARWTLG